MNADTPTQDELRKDLPRLNQMVGEVEGWSAVSLEYQVGLCPGRHVDDYTAEEILNYQVPLDDLPLYTTSHDACRTFEDAMGEEEFIRYCGIQYDMILARRPRQTSVLPVAYLLAEFAKLTPVDRCIARLIVAGRIK